MTIAATTSHVSALAQPGLDLKAVVKRVLASVHIERDERKAVALPLGAVDRFVLEDRRGDIRAREVHRTDRRATAPEGPLR